MMPFAPLVTSLPTPGEIRAALPAASLHQDSILKWRETIINILSRKDPRLLIIVGPCAIQSTEAALEYASRLRSLASSLSDQFFIVMRAYVEKSRSAADWKGFLYNRGENNALLDGLIASRQLFLGLVEHDIPIAMEFLDPLAADYLSDLVSWGCIGARTVQSPIHRELASRLPMPVGMKNTTDGSIDVAIQAIRAVQQRHLSFGMTEHGRICQLESPGNPHAHLVLRGSIFGPNYRPSHIQKAVDLLRRAGLSESLVIDCSHGNSQKKWERQPEIFHEVLQTMFSTANSPVRGLMVESFLLEGRQELLLRQVTEEHKKREIRYGASPVDGCLSWNATVELLSSAHEMCCRIKERVDC